MAIADRVNIIRGKNKRVTNLLSAFGQLKETNVTAMLGYLIHLNPSLVKTLFNVEYAATSVYVELSNEEDRYDIAFDAGGIRYIVEVKLDQHDTNQLHRYYSKHKNVFVIGRRVNSRSLHKKLYERFFDWESVIKFLVKTKKNSGNPLFDHLVDDFILHLKEQGVVVGELKDVYLRDLSGDSVDWYFNKKVFITQAKYYDNAKSARYFAPYLTTSNSTKERFSVFKALGVGVSFISKINSTGIGKPKDLRALMSEHELSKAEVDEIFKLQKWTNATNEKFAIFFLGQPLRLFAHPVTKPQLGLQGAMPSIAIDFGDLIGAANGIKPVARSKK